ncbi:FHA domain-containing protein [Scardovia inopinata]|uniref:FHA domain-containing protein n=1 Tax=Scardovia inopinata F0304 TaxID=641146 RepID=W5IHU0_SCAIO|nr:hypothetical protein HMPREF9020_00037 [Scardovia inopinata F0304]BAR07459.1 conserved hypothetical protein [Scardovia inopinata JCM 12537]SUV51532.1 FHA domain-containing protein [Scardovia inopinata]
MITDLTFAVMKYGFLALLWFFVFLAVRSLRKDVSQMSPVPRKRSKKAESDQHFARSTAAPASPAPLRGAESGRQQGRASVLTIIDGPLSGTTYTLGSQSITLGRASDNVVVLNDEFVSSHHARVYVDPTTGTWAIEDLGSTNGTVVDGQRLSHSVPLPAGVPVRIGGTSFELR